MASPAATQGTAARILASARRLLEQEGVEAVTLRPVARAVGITPMAVYRHFADRAALLAALAEEGFAALAAQLEAARLRGPFARQLALLVDTFLEQALAHPRLFELMFLHPRPGARRYPRDWRAGLSPTANVWARVLREGIAAGALAPGDVWAMVFTSGAMLQGLIMLYLGGRVELSRAQFRKLCHQSLRRFYGIAV